MIVFDLDCAEGHRFEGWFRNSEDFAEQQERGAIACPKCDVREVRKALSPVRIARHGGRDRAASGSGGEAAEPRAQFVSEPPPALRVEMRAALAKLRRRVERTCEHVGKDFAEEARRIHYGERAAGGIYGEATAAEVAGLVEEGIEVMPLPGPARREDA